MRKQVNKDGFSHGVIFDGKGGAKRISFEELDNYNEQMGTLWVHFDYYNYRVLQNLFFLLHLFHQRLGHVKNLRYSFVFSLYFPINLGRNI